jgi:CDP-diglyceride synthetase
MKLDVVAQALFLIVVANGAPILAARLLGRRFSRPVDGGALFLDGRPLFGRSKTLRGLVASVTATAMAAHFIGLSVTTGAAIAALAMAGDLLSSFLKRRITLPPSAQALGLDYFPESFLPAVYAASAMPLTAVETATVLALFFVAGIILQRVVYALKLGEQPN